MNFRHTSECSLFLISYLSTWEMPQNGRYPSAPNMNSWELHRWNGNVFPVMLIWFLALPWYDISAILEKKFCPKNLIFQNSHHAIILALSCFWINALTSWHEFILEKHLFHSNVLISGSISIWRKLVSGALARQNFAAPTRSKKLVFRFRGHCLDKWSCFHLTSMSFSVVWK